MANNSIGIEIDIDSNGAVRSLRQLGSAGQSAGNQIEQGTENANRGMGEFLRSLPLVKIGIAAIGFAALKLTKDFITMGVSAQKEAENIQAQFQTLLGGAMEAKERFGELAEFAANTPFNLIGVAKASKILQTMGGDALATGEGLRMVGDASAIAGVPINELAVTIGRLVSGLKNGTAVGEPIARLAELGLVSGEARTEIDKLQKAGDKEGALEALQTELDKTKGGMEILSRTASGLESTLVDTFEAIGRTVVTETGIFDLYKGSLTALISLGADLKDAFDSTSISKVKSELDDVNTELARTREIILSSIDLDVDLSVFEEREKVLSKQAKSLRDALAPADLKDKQKELSKEFETLTSNVISYTNATDISADTISAFTTAALGGSARILPNTKAFYKTQTDLTKKRISELNVEIQAIKARVTASKTVSGKADTTTTKTDVQAKVNLNNKILELKLIQELSTQKNKLAEQEQKIALQNYETGKALSQELRTEQLSDYKQSVFQIEEEARIREEKADILYGSTIEGNEILAETLIMIEQNKNTKLEELALDKKNKDDKIIDDRVKKEQQANMAILYSSSRLATGILSLQQAAFGQYKIASIAQAVINTSVGVTKAFAQGGTLGFITGAGIATAGATQIANISKQKFADGGYISGAGTNRSDSIDARVSNGEFIVNAQSTENNREVLEAINSGGNASNSQSVSITINAGVGTDLDALAQAVTDGLQRAKTLGLEPEG